MSFIIRLAFIVASGLWMGYLLSVRRLPVSARFAVYAATGLVTLSVEMFLLSALQIAWSVATLVALPLAAAAVSYLPAVQRRVRTAKFNETGPWTPRTIAFIVIAALAAVVLSIAIFAGEATSFDLLLFWGPKSVVFARAHMIDVQFLADPHNSLMHSDYPPLLPFSYAWTMLGKAGLNWWGVIGMTPLFLILTAAALHGFARYARSPMASSITALFASLYAYLYIVNAVGGNGESALIFFEALALAALTCTRVTADEHAVIASVALAGAVLTKVEGAPFALLSLVSIFLSDWPWRERVRTFLRASIGPALALIGWISFSAHHHLLDSYRPLASALTLNSTRAAIDLVGKEASFGIAYLPWIVLVVLAVIGRVRPALPQLFVAASSVLFLLFVYARNGDRDFHAGWSAMRALLTPLLCLLFAALAASRPPRLSQAQIPAAVDSGPGALAL
ncbi:MAG TPA: hypothetical protein VHX14_23935 [Thermoanaerobaculia bacterium]|jgi:hypothetical protein|nr:hypothetical protein [Thermoanaerobaculia bacterium]